MLTHPTLDQMHSLGLAGMAAAWRDIAEQDTSGDLIASSITLIASPSKATACDDKKRLQA